MFEVPIRNPETNVTWRAAQVQLHRGKRSAANEPLVLDMQRSTALARFAATHKTADARESQESGKNKDRQQHDTDALEAPLFRLELEVFVDFEGARFLAHRRLPFIHCSIGSRASTARHSPHPAMTSGQNARPHAIPTAAASHVDAAVVSPRTDCSDCPQI